MRSVLTMLGIVIGVVSIIALITIVQGATNNISNEVIELGEIKYIKRICTALKQGLTQKDVELIEDLDNIRGISPTISGKATVVYEGKLIENVIVEGKNEVYFKADPDLLSCGRTINILDLESKNQVAVIGDNLVKELFFGVNPIGEKLIVNGVTYTVVGTFKASTGFGLGSTNDTVAIPYTTALRSLGVKVYLHLTLILTIPV